MSEQVRQALRIGRNYFAGLLMVAAVLAVVGGVGVPAAEAKGASAFDVGAFLSGLFHTSGLVAAGGASAPPPISVLAPPVVPSSLASSTPQRLSGGPGGKKKQAFVDGEVLVKYRDGQVSLQAPAGDTAVKSFSAKRHLKEKMRLRKANMSLLEISDGKTVDQKIQEIQSDPSVEYAQPNYQYYQQSLGTNDPSAGMMWGLENTGQTVNGTAGTSGADVKAVGAWAIADATSSSPVIVAVIDSGVAYNHPDLTANMWNGSSCKDDSGVAIGGGCTYGYDYADGDTTPLPAWSNTNVIPYHGTEVAGTIAAVRNNAHGGVGLAPNAKIMAIKVDMTSAQIVRAINFAKQNGAKIINASFGAAGPSGGSYDAALYSAIAGFPGLFIAAAGNNAFNHDDGNSAHIVYPAGFEVATGLGPGLANIVSVAATDQNDALASFSDYGASSVDVGAPGANMYLPSFLPTQLINENFEGTTPPALPAGWSSQGTNVHWGTYNYGGNKVLIGDTNINPYTASANGLALTPSFNMAGAAGAVVSFQTLCETPYSSSSWYDYMSLNYYDGSAAHQYVPVAGWQAWNEYVLDTLNGVGQGVASYNFSNVPLPTPYAANSFVYFQWYTDASDNNHFGCIIDSLTVSKYTALDGSDEKYEYDAGTSFAAPMVAAEAALIESYNPSLTAAQVKSIILTSGDSDASLAGKTVTGKRINALKALQAANPSKDITAFSLSTTFLGTGTAGTISGNNISVVMPYGTSLASLYPTITITGASVNPASGIAHDFTSPVSYVVTAADGSTKTYTVTVTLASGGPVLSCHP